jgi:DNA repair protein RadA/Sms
LRDVPVDPKVCVFGEVGLAGEVRGVSHARRRVQEASKFGFKTCILPTSSADEGVDAALEITPAARIEEVLEAGLGG